MYGRNRAQATVKDVNHGFTATDKYACMYCSQERNTEEAGRCGPLSPHEQRQLRLVRLLLYVAPSAIGLLTFWIITPRK